MHVTDNSGPGLGVAGALSRLLGCSALALLAACAASPAGEGNQMAGADDARECRNYTVTGSNLPRRVCRDKAEWEEIDAAQRRTADEYGRQTRENSALVEPGFTRGQPSL